MHIYIYIHIYTLYVYIYIYKPESRLPELWEEFGLPDIMGGIRITRIYITRMFGEPGWLKIEQTGPLLHEWKGPPLLLVICGILRSVLIISIRKSQK